MMLYPASNGYIAFGAPHDTWYINIPDVGGINNLLALAGYDLDPTTGGSIYYSVEGTAPYRQLQLRYDDVTLAISPDHFIDVTTVLYESTNIIDLYVDKLPEVGAFGFVQGISNEDGSQYYYTKTTAHRFGLSVQTILRSGLLPHYARAQFLILFRWWEI